MNYTKILLTEPDCFDVIDCRNPHMNPAVPVNKDLAIKQWDSLVLQYRKLVEKHGADKSGKSKVTTSYFDFESKDMAYVQCYDYSDETGWQDNLKVGIAKKEFVYFIENEAYK